MLTTAFCLAGGRIGSGSVKEPKGECSARPERKGSSETAGEARPLGPCVREA